MPWRMLVVALLLRPLVALAAPPSVIFILLDTTRADRLSALGNPRPTTPTLDALAARGVLFERHFANAHATRPSMPQLMSGRYYHEDILKPFMPDRHPREFSFTRPDPHAALLPELLRREGYHTLGASAHLWVVADSPFGRHFDRLDLLQVDPALGHAGADQVVDRGIALWRERDRERPVFLYLHFMDMHIPRLPPPERFRFTVPGYDWRTRFSPGSEPLFNRERRRWDRSDARDFTAEDRAHYAAVYDGHLAATDAALGRLLAAVRVDDPDLARTVIVVVADHGEELGEDGRTYHTESLADGVQHIPWIMAGGPIAAGQRMRGFTENVDVLPTVLSVLGIDRPAAVRVDGRVQLGRDGRLAATAPKRAVYYAWETYRAVRTRDRLLRVELPASLRARCVGAETVYAVDGPRRTVLEPARTAAVRNRLRRRIADRLDRREARYLKSRYGAPLASFVVGADFWRLDGDVALACGPLAFDSARRDLDVSGWFWSGSGVTIIHPPAPAALAVRLVVPDGDYLVEAAAVPIARMPWVFGFRRWLRKSFVAVEPARFVPLGTFHGAGGTLAVGVPPGVADRQHVVALRLTPPGATPGVRAGPVDERQRQQLKALGYVQ